jgi:hypothetical protein
MPKGKFAVVFGGLSLWIVEGETPLDARLEAANQLRNIASTGRLSHVEPNLQNIPVRTPEGRSIRSAFVPGPVGCEFMAVDYSQIELRFLSGFPEFTAGELRFGHEVKPGDSFPDQYNVTETVVRNANDLEGVTRSWPPGTAATPPFRAHENSPGCWTIPAFADSRQAVREAILGSVDDDRLAGGRFFVVE